MTTENPLRQGAGTPGGSTSARLLEGPGKLYAPGMALYYFGWCMAILTPVMLTLPLKVQALVGSEHAAGAFGLVTAIGAVVAMICTPLGGRLSDRTTSRFGMRRPWIIVGAIGGMLSLLLIAVATSLWMVIVGWILTEIFFNTAWSAANATVADQVPPGQRGLVSGLIGIGLPLALLTGSVVVNAFDGYTYRFGVPALILVIFATFFALTLRDRRLDQRPARLSLKEFALTFVFNPRKHPDFGWLWIGRFAIMFSYSGIQVYLVYLLGSRLGLKGGELTGTIVLANLGSAIAMIASSFLIGALSDRFHRRKVFAAAGSLIMALALAMIAFAPSASMVIVASTILGFGGGGFFAVDFALATELLPQSSDTGKDLGVWAVTNALPQSVAPAIAPGIIALGTSAISGYSLLYLVGAVVAVLGAVFIYRIKGAS
ncbi:MFS transporter [Sphaerisporangium perillae]|uniref:MFS transporter n=1 Tax=Sphaerisporangium perillae TaxID=2935860 RepID=UPI0020107E72|nr:MFS transporter [Sphaerisporangium perillae]